MVVENELVSFLLPSIRELLSDGQWHRLGELVPLAARIPPEKASQRYFHSMNKERRAKLKTRNASYFVSRGRDSILAAAVRHLVENGKMDRKQVNGVDMIQLVVGTPKDEEGNVLSQRTLKRRTTIFK